MNARAALLVAAALCTAASLPAEAQIRFLGEYIDFTLTDSAFGVKAVYRFTNAGSPAARHMIAYPFPEELRAISDIRVTDLRTGEAVAFDTAARAITFSLALAEADTADILVTYRQPARRRNVYILRSTRQWGSALEFARYTLRVDRRVAVAGFSYAPDRREETAEACIYRWSRTNFMPDEDFIVTVGD
jgi:hypothetical protein